VVGQEKRKASVSGILTEAFVGRSCDGKRDAYSRPLCYLASSASIALVSSADSGLTAER
jgi:hypothetical protein